MWFINLVWEERHFFLSIFCTLESELNAKVFYHGSFFAKEYVIIFLIFVVILKTVFDCFSTTWYEFHIAKGFLIELKYCLICIDTQRFFVMITSELLLFTTWFNKYIKQVPVIVTTKICILPGHLEIKSTGYHKRGSRHCLVGTKK